jgi:hypothetical protein
MDIPLTALGDYAAAKRIKQFLRPDPPTLTARFVGRTSLGYAAYAIDIGMSRFEDMITHYEITLAENGGQPWTRQVVHGQTLVFSPHSTVQAYLTAVDRLGLRSEPSPSVEMREPDGQSSPFGTTTDQEVS